jgi:hypothetical protein
MDLYPGTLATRPQRRSTPKHTQTLIDATQKETVIDQHQDSFETLICQRHLTILRFLPSVAPASTRWQVRELYCQNLYAYLNVTCKLIRVRNNTLLVSYIFVIPLCPDLM